MEPGFHRNAAGEIEDDEGNTYYEDYHIKKEREAPDELLVKAREFVRIHHGDVDVRGQEDLARHYAVIEREKRKDTEKLRKHQDNKARREAKKNETNK